VRSTIQANAFAERFVRSIKEECLRRVIFFGRESLRRAITEYMAHFHEERNHQGLENRLIRETPAISANDAAIHRRIRLGGMLSYYHRVAA
jgi:transposase InsO family protein